MDPAVRLVSRDRQFARHAKEYDTRRLPTVESGPCADTGMLPAAIVLAAGFAEPRKARFASPQSNRIA